MKITVLIAALALACGPVLAHTQNKAGSGERQAKVSKNGVVDKTKRGLKRAGDATRRTGERLGKAINRTPNRDRTEQAGRNDARSMGSAGADTAASGRRARMDEAYDSWKSNRK